MKLKRILAVLAAAILVTSLMAGCNDNDKGSSSNKSSAPGTGSSGIVSSIESGASELGSNITSGAESLTSDAGSGETGGSQTAVTGKLKEAYDAVKNAFGENYIPSMPYDETYISEQFKLSKDMYKQIVAEGPMISVNVDTFIGVEAADGKAADVEKALKAYAQTLADESLQYPMNVAKVKAAQVKSFDNYVFFVMLGVGTDDVMDKDEAGQLEYYKGENQKALDAIAAVMK